MAVTVSGRGCTRSVEARGQEPRVAVRCSAAHRVVVCVSCCGGEEQVGLGRSSRGDGPTRRPPLSSADCPSEMRG